jgi:hypothetical protein
VNPGTELSDLRKLVRAYGVLAGTCDAERAIVGRISRRWIAAEVEHMLPLSEIPYRFYFSNRGREVLASEFFPGQDIDPLTINPDDLDIRGRGRKIFINSNRIPKLEPVINASVVTSNLLLGVQLYGAMGKGMAEVDNDWIIAAMLCGTVGKRHRYSALLPEKYTRVGVESLRVTFGVTIAERVEQLLEALAAFDAAVKALAPLPEFEPHIANAVAAIMISRLRLTARAAGDGVLAYAGETQARELEEKGIDTQSDFAEKPYLARDFQWADVALGLKGVDHSALREPIRNTLMIAVQDALDDPDKRFRLAGRRGKAVHDVHINMPVMEYYVAAEAPNTLATLHVASLEMMRYLEKGRRKSYSTMLAHAFRISAIAESTLGRALEPGIATIALLHDVVEDGSSQVTGYDQSLQKIMFRFGGPIAAMVSELTDSNVKQDAQQKAMMTFNHPELMMPDKQYNTGRLNKMALKATDAERPYTLAGIIVKLIDTSVSFDEGIRDPDLMSGWWCHSGVRIYWAERVRGAIIKPLIERLVIEVQQSHEHDPSNARQLDRMARKQLRSGVALIAITLDYADLYAAQNLAILADEFALAKPERDKMIRNFFNPDISVAEYQRELLEDWLTEERLDQQIAEGHVPSKSYVALYPRTVGDSPHRDISTFHEYIHSARRRIQIRQQLGLYSPRKRVRLQERIGEVIRLYDLRMRAKAELED